MLEVLRTAKKCVAGNMTESIEYPYVFRWNRLDRKGQHCKVTARGKLNSCRIEFEDGFVVITNRNALRKRSSTKEPQATGSRR